MVVEHSTVWMEESVVGFTSKEATRSSNDAVENSEDLLGSLDLLGLLGLLDLLGSLGSSNSQNPQDHRMRKRA